MVCLHPSPLQMSGCATVPTATTKDSEGTHACDLHRNVQDGARVTTDRSLNQTLGGVWADHIWTSAGLTRVNHLTGLGCGPG